MNNKYTKNLENVIKQMLRPLKNIPLNLVIEGISGNKILPFHKKNNKDRLLLENLIQAVKIASNDINMKGLYATRPNEAGNAVEPFVKKALVKVGYKADTPLTKGNKKKSTGYPDIEFTDQFQRSNYLECKTYNIKNIATTQRSFYLSPSENFKITKDAHHLLISFEVFPTARKNVYKCKSWKILTLDNLLVDVKYEFNSDNRRLYIKNSILAEGRV